MADLVDRIHWQFSSLDYFRSCNYTAFLGNKCHSSYTRPSLSSAPSKPKIWDRENKIIFFKIILYFSLLGHSSRRNYLVKTSLADLQNHLIPWEIWGFWTFLLLQCLQKSWPVEDIAKDIFYSTPPLRIFLWKWMSSRYFTMTYSNIFRFLFCKTKCSFSPKVKK